ncbi:MAG: PEP/pyruvate-binding domain-containing protein [Fibrobacterota bacterium]
MERSFVPLSTGLKGLDKVIQGVIPGDNIVWQVDSIEDYAPAVVPFARFANENNRRLIYFRFADHDELIPEDIEAEIYRLHPEDGFETFISEIFDVIEESGIGAYYVFDSLSELAVDWYSDRMLGNFFMLTCPYLYDYETVTYFALLKNYHTEHAVKAIHSTAQVVGDIYSKDGNLYLQPQKVHKRYSPTMYMLHRWEGENFSPVKNSAVVSEVMAKEGRPWLDFSSQRNDLWARTFMDAQNTLEDLKEGKAGKEDLRECSRKLINIAVTRDPKLFELADKFLDIRDLIQIKKRMVGTGLIGGKSAGMLLSRSIIRKSDPELAALLETHDSFFIGSDVFYTYLIQNGCWWIRRKQRNASTLLDGADEARRRLRSGDFPKDIQDQFMEILEYFGQSPIIVRSSSLLEDAYGNAFSGKYESVFCANQGTPLERLESFMNAVRTIYASTMNREALLYRAQRGLLDSDEQMAILVQRVSGNIYGNLFYPHAAGVGFSFNPYVWNSEIDPSSGMLRLVFGLGTRAVDRADDDYTRVVSLNAPGRRPESNFDEVKKYTQRRVDILNLNSNRLSSALFEEVVEESENLPLDMFATRDGALVRAARGSEGKNIFPWVLTFSNLFEKTDFISSMRKMLALLHKAYDYPVDIEFTLNFSEKGDFKINIVQCRPFQWRSSKAVVENPPEVNGDKLVIRTEGPIIGNSSELEIDTVIYVVPELYSSLSIQDKYNTARNIGKITSYYKNENKRIMLVGPGRWGTSSPNLGVPVNFAEINNVSVLCEIAMMREGLVPDVSLGTHFFNDLVEQEILYMAVYPKNENSVINRDFFENSESITDEILPESKNSSGHLKVLNTGGQSLCMNFNSIKQKVVCYKK